MKFNDRYRELMEARPLSKQLASDFKAGRHMGPTLVKALGKKLFGKKKEPDKVEELTKRMRVLRNLKHITDKQLGRIVKSDPASVKTYVTKNIRYLPMEMIEAINKFLAPIIKSQRLERKLQNWPAIKRVASVLRKQLSFVKTYEDENEGKMYVRKKAIGLNRKLMELVVKALKEEFKSVTYKDEVISGPGFTIKPKDPYLIIQAGDDE